MKIGTKLMFAVGMTAGIAGAAALGAMAWIELTAVTDLTKILGLL
jgi:hypothetical protein